MIIINMRIFGEKQKNNSLLISHKIKVINSHLSFHQVCIIDLRFEKNIIIKQQRSNIMKTLTSVAVFAIASVLSFNAMAESKVNKSIILNKSLNKGNAAIAIGKGNSANVGSVSVKGSKVNKSIILNKSLNKGNAAIAIGKGNAANVGSVSLKGSKVNKSIILNKSLNKGNAAIAIGKSNVANVGSVSIRDSKVNKSIILNKSLNKGNAAIAIGKGNSANVGSVSFE